ncbi:MAG: helix-turn-helix domain-containing protein [Ktedonobacteraceae bacterium]
MIRVFVIAPTPMMQAGLRTMLTSTEVQVVGASSSADAASTELADIDVFVVDETLLEDVGRTLTNIGLIALVVLTNNIERSLALLRSLSLRSWSVVSLDATAAQLQAAVVAVAQGFVVLPSAYSVQLYEQRPAANAVMLGVVDESLTAREREVLELVSQGLSNKLIARRLQISEHTVKFHISSISTKLGAASRTDAVSRGVRLGLITL